MSYFAQSADDHTITSKHAYYYASGVVLCTVVTCFTYHPIVFYSLRKGIRCRLGFCGLIYQKTLRLIKSSTEEGDNGKIVNLLSVISCFF